LTLILFVAETTLWKRQTMKTMEWNTSSKYTRRDHSWYRDVLFNSIVIFHYIW